ncbi:MAG: hypothetical protein E6I76_02155 [Chloroflexi bacterium]|nr:MAG: hypothetical protein E6I76_02155 [Chloroflexota bacterium]
MSGVLVLARIRSRRPGGRPAGRGPSPERSLASHDNPAVNMGAVMPRLTCALGPDSAGDLLAGIIGGASDALDLAVYEVGPSYAGPLAAAASRGVRVRLLVDGHAGANAASARLLAGCGAEVRVWARRPAEAHWKLLVAGDATLAVGSGNLIARDALAACARAALEAAWGEADPPPAAWAGAVAEVPAVGVPRPAVAALEVDVDPGALELVTGGRVVAALLAARLGGVRHRALVTVPYVHPHVIAVAGLLRALAAAAGRGADVRLLLGGVPDPADLAAVRGLGLAARVMDPARSTTGHAKGAVLDGAAIAGSANWSGAGLGANLEAALAADDPAAAGYFAAAFERDWAASG